MRAGMAAQNLDKEKNKWQWIQVRKQIGPSDWTYKMVSVSNGRQIGFQTQIQFEPKLSKANSIFNYGHDFYHKTITLQISVGLPNINNDTDMRICYIPMSTKEKDAFLENSKIDIRNYQSCSSKSFKSYVWMFDICLVKLVFRNGTDNTKSITKNFHLEFESGNFKRDGHSLLCPDGLAHITKSDLISMDDLKNILGYQQESRELSFISLDIEFRARLHLGLMIPNIQTPLFLFDEQSLLDISGMQLFQSEDMAVSAMNSFLPRSGSQLIFSDRTSDITFELASGPSKVMHAHSWVLAAQSPVFRRMLSADMLEKKTGVIKLEDDTTSDSLQILLTYMYRKMGFLSYSQDVDSSSKYTSIEEWTVGLSLNILSLAHRYQINDLTEFCFDSIISRPDSEINTQLAVQIFKAGMLYENDDLGTRFVDWVERQASVKKVKTELMELIKEESQTSLWNLVRLLIN